MAKISSEFDFSNTIKVFDFFTATNTYYVNNKPLVVSFTHSGYIDAGAQNDIIDASAATDYWNTYTLLGGSGKDQITGTLGNDIVDGGPDADLIDAGNGDDRVTYDPVDIFVNGGAGLDILDASAAGLKGRGVTIDLNLTKDAYIGFESIIGSAYADKLTGDDGFNSLDGGPGNDSLYGGGNSDALIGGAGADAMYGGAGDDSFFVAAGADHPAGEVISGGDGNDIIWFTSTTPGDTLTLRAGDSAEFARTEFFDWELNIDASLMQDTVAIELSGSFGNNRLTGNGAANLIYGDSGDDIIDGGLGGDIIDAGYGNDTVVYNASYSFVDGGPDFGTPDSDTIDASGAAATDANGAGINIDLSSGSDPYVNFENITGSAFNDTLTGDDNANVLNGGFGNDILTGKGSSDTFALSAGDDVILDFQLPEPSDVLLDFEGLGHAAGIDSYKGFNWINAAAVTPGIDPFLFPTGYNAVLHSGTNAAFDGGAVGLGLFRSDDFDLESGYFAAAWNNDLIVTIAAWDDGLQVGTATLQIDPVQVFVDFAAGTHSGADSATFEGRFTSIDHLTIDGFGGTDAGFGGGGEFVAMDDLTMSVTTGDQIDVPDGTDVAALIASAQSDGNGGTLLSHDLGTLTLIGVDPGTLSPDWFI